ncbi:MAG: acyl carrier protein [Oligoflexales bacterium]|nr:acyl carrier protein [Oligoflexales bacterium]
MNVQNRLNREEVAGKIDSILVEQLELGGRKLSPEMKLFEELGMDSLDAIDMVISCKKNFGIEIKEEDAKNIKTLSDVHELVYRLYEKTLQ